MLTTKRETITIERDTDYKETLFTKREMPSMKTDAEHREVLTIWIEKLIV